MSRQFAQNIYPGRVNELHIHPRLDTENLTSLNLYRPRNIARMVDLPPGYIAGLRGGNLIAENHDPRGENNAGIYGLPVLFFIDKVPLAFLSLCVTVSFTFEKRRTN